MKRLVIAFLALMSMQAFSGEHEDKIRKLFEIQDVISTYQNLLDQNRKQAIKQSDQTMAQIMSQLNPPKEFQIRLKQAADKYVKAVLTDRTAKQIVEVLVKYYSPKLTENELDELIRFYSSELGKKITMVDREGSQYLMKHYEEENARIVNTATSAFIKDIQLIAMECNCEKQSGNKKK